MYGIPAIVMLVFVMTGRARLSKPGRSNLALSYYTSGVESRQLYVYGCLAQMALNGLTQLCYYAYVRGVAQPGSALAWGARGRRFESGHPDHI